MKNPDILLLDEPTNHLDIEATEWLEKYLGSYKGTVVTISHDRYFLDHVTNKTIDLEDGEATVYLCSYSKFVKEKEKKLLDEFKEYEEQQKKIKKMKEAIKRLQEWANQANPPNEGLHKRARHMERMLERMKKKKRPMLEHKKINLAFEMKERSGKEVISLQNVSKSYSGKSLLQNIHLDVYFKERLAIVGSNGSGKTTLLKLIMQQVLPDSGDVKIGSNTQIGYLSQHTLAEASSHNVMDTFRQKIVVTEGEARHILAKFLFYGPAVFKKVAQLSGGEKMRLQLAIIMYQKLNLLILDEPTNHLDIDSREVLEEALLAFDGTILCVSHDRYLLNKCFTKTCWLENGRLEMYVKCYDEARLEKTNRMNLR
ncbi:ABC-F family ATP-binding cassette domain-containing protein [Bacillus capparidis]|uniref:ATPase subunit of ABC transporter with duplicated ATPase domains n=1 Tax=Bacillus capparidis TaxID=1840411 RepID=A0ABS4CV41_9BACI|nr:ABC-F family ATP-binding cassette domain-containing protein [Bacillus capparidis]MBP1080998.1 ATPase subunit of ABC transporter with duplicated ATPase domains [Bacillus capparidis]MED1095693.1 ABC-F family ATP-binding cassette domain-containing protein [Bacillus capparidis]